jgi:hypothetical protein
VNYEIKALEQRVEDLLEQLTVARKELNDAQIAAAPFKVGDEVIAKGRSAIIRQVEPQSWGTWYRVSFRKKDGTWGTAVQRVFSGVKAAS